MEYIAVLGLLLVIVLLVAIRRRWNSYLILFIAVVTVTLFGYLLADSWQYFSSHKSSLLAIFLSGFIASLLIIWFSLSQRTRSQLKVRLAKTFSLYKYDYRESWLGFNSALDFAAHQEQTFYPQTIKALAEMVSSSGGKLWTANAHRFTFTDHWNSPLASGESFSLSTNLIDFIKKTHWVVDVNEYIKDPKIYSGLILDLENFKSNPIKIFVPLRRESELVGIVGLKALDDTQNLNWEDHDLLKAAGQQMASYISLYEATSRLYEQREFAAFNRLSTFVVHDLKNVSAQLELITQNSSKFGTNADFIEDTFETVKSANQRLSKMLNQLQRKEATKSKIEKCYLPRLVEALQDRVKLKGEIPDVYVLGSLEQISNIILHLDDNAQQAVAEKSVDNTKIRQKKKSHLVNHQLELKDGDIFWHIIDQGVGMSEEYMREKLFKPFETTKGNAGMGVGVYQCRYLLRSNDGDLIIRSQLGKGTHCTAILSVITEIDAEMEKTEDQNESE